MNKLLLAAAGTVLAACTATASSAGTFIFNEGTFGTPVNFTLYDDFNYDHVADDSKVTGHGYDFLTGDIPSRSASIPGNATPYLSVDGGGEANITFTDPVRSFSFDYSTVDTYNTLTILYADDSTQAFNGTEILSGFPTGKTSGSLIVNGNGKLIKGLTLDTTSAAFEVDNLSISANLISGVPEAGTWAMMLVGFGAIGAASRRRRTSLTFA